MVVTTPKVAAAVAQNKLDQVCGQAWLQAVYKLFLCPSARFSDFWQASWQLHRDLLLVCIDLMQ